jgi:hypothetical protein
MPRPIPDKPERQDRNQAKLNQTMGTAARGGDRIEMQHEADTKYHQDQNTE